MHAHHKRKSLTLLICLMLVLAAGVYYVVASVAPSPASAGPLVLDASYRAPGKLIVHHSFKNGVHTYSGEVPVETDCQTVSGGVASATAVVLSVYTQGALCGSLPAGSTQPFMVSTAASSVVKSVSINGMNVPFTLTQG